ncbi:MAG: hypothetical protein IPM82_10930 [Saprospiraceae bacterium]|nr:hypothetical protein [Saprospiraceae bacterium]
MFKMQLALCTGDPSFESGKNNIINRAKSLATKANVPVVRQKLDLINRIQTDGFWKEITLPGLEHIRTELRELMKLLVSEGKDPVFTNFEDELVSVHEPLDVLMPSAPANYLERVKTFIRNNREYVVIQKLRNNQPITAQELSQLETLLFDGSERGTKADFVRATGSNQPLGQFIRSILGLDRSAALAAFSTFWKGQAECRPAKSSKSSSTISR